MTKLSTYSSSGNYLTKDDVAAPIQVVIASTSEHTFDGKSPQLVLHFTQPGVKPMVLNRTNARLLESLFPGAEVEQLPGKTIEIYADPTVTMHSKPVGGLRLRRPQHGLAAPPPPAQPPVAQTGQPTPAQQHVQHVAQEPQDAPWNG